MGAKQVTRWLWSRFAEVDSMKIRYPISLNNEQNLNYDELKRLEQTKEDIKHIRDLLIVNTEPFLTYEKVRAKIYQALQRIKIKVVFLDHLQRCNIPNRQGQNEARAIEEFVYRVADMAKEYNIAFILLSQLSNIAENRKATIKDLKHSGGIAEGTDFIGVMNRVSRIDMNNKDSNELLIGCWQRDGRSAEISIQCDLTIGKFQDNLIGY